MDLLDLRSCTMSEFDIREAILNGMADSAECAANFCEFRRVCSHNVEMARRSVFFMPASMQSHCSMPASYRSITTRCYCKQVVLQPSATFHMRSCAHTSLDDHLFGWLMCVPACHAMSAVWAARMSRHKERASGHRGVQEAERDTAGAAHTLEAALEWWRGAMDDKALEDAATRPDHWLMQQLIQVRRVHRCASRSDSFSLARNSLYCPHRI